MFRYLARHKLGAVAFILVLVGSMASILYFLHRGQERIQHLYVPKLLMLRIDEVPFPKGRKLPVDVMAGMPVSITCENINPPAGMGRPVYRFHVGGRTVEASTCVLDVPVPGDIGSTQTVGLDYLLRKPAGSPQVIDHWEALVRPMPAGEYLRIRNFGTRNGRPLPNLTVPREVIPYVEAAVKLPGKTADYVVLFFVQPLGTDSPVLQVTSRPNSAEKVEAIAGPLTRYRRFGPGIGGYAAWPAAPIQIGSPEDERGIFEVYAGIFEAKNIRATVNQLVSFEGVTKDGQAQVKVLPKRLAEIKALAWHGWVSDPMRVVRAADSPPESAASPNP